MSSKYLTKDFVVTTASICQYAYRDNNNAFIKRMKEMGYDVLHQFNGNRDSSGAILKCEKTIVVLFKGTDSLDDWKVNFDAKLSDAHEDNKKIKVHNGFYDTLLEDKEGGVKIFNTIKSIIGDQGDDIDLVITGHSLGGAMATLFAYKVHEEFNIQGVHVYGSPRVGNKHFAYDYNNKLSNVTIRFWNGADVVPSVPFWKYKHIKNEIFLNKKAKAFKGKPLKYHIKHAIISLITGKAVTEHLMPITKKQIVRSNYSINLLK